MNSVMVENFHNNLINLAQNCGLTPATAYYVLKDVTNEIHSVMLQTIQQELHESAEQTEEVTIPIEGEEGVDNGNTEQTRE